MRSPSESQTLPNRSTRNVSLISFCLLVLFTSISVEAQTGAKLLDDYVASRVGSFSSAAQAAQDERYDAIVWHLVEIWPNAGDGRWLYVESRMAETDQPYMQRLVRATANDDGTLTETRYRVAEPEALAGLWKEPQSFPPVGELDLTEVTGCDALVVRAGVGRFEGATRGRDCLNRYKGATYTLSRSSVEADVMTNWDRGFDDQGQRVWGPATGPYRFLRSGEQPPGSRSAPPEVCVEPVRMLVHGEIFDRAAFGAYVGALAESGLYPEVGGYYEAISPALEIFEGDPPAGRGVVIARFPCLEAARKFWNSPRYAEIRKLRKDAAAFEVLVLASPPKPATLKD